MVFVGVASWLVVASVSDRSSGDLFASPIEELRSASSLAEARESSTPTTSTTTERLEDSTIEESTTPALEPTSVEADTTTSIGGETTANEEQSKESVWERATKHFRKLVSISEPAKPANLKVVNWDLSWESFSNPLANHIRIDPETFRKRKTESSKCFSTFVAPMMDGFEDWLGNVSPSELPSHRHLVTEEMADELGDKVRELMSGIEDLLMPSTDDAKNDSYAFTTTVGDVFTENMFQEFLVVMEDSASIIGFHNSTCKRMKRLWEEEIGGQKPIRDMTIAEFVLNAMIQESEIIVTAHAQTHQLTNAVGETNYRPSMMTGYSEEITNVSGWWTEWLAFMFEKKDTFIPNEGGRTEMKTRRELGSSRMQWQASYENVTTFVEANVASTMTAKAYKFSPRFEEAWYKHGHWKRRLRAIWDRCGGSSVNMSVPQLKVCAAVDPQIAILFKIKGAQSADFTDWGEDTEGTKITALNFPGFVKWATETRYGEDGEPASKDVDTQKLQHESGRLIQPSLQKGRTYWSNGYRYHAGFNACPRWLGPSCSDSKPCDLSFGGTDRVECQTGAGECKCKKGFCMIRGKCEPDEAKDAGECLQDTQGMCPLGICDHSRGAVCRHGRCVCAFGCAREGQCVLNNTYGWCQVGISDVTGTACCAAGCNRCIATDCRKRNGTEDECCPGQIWANGKLCDHPLETSCMISKAPSDYHSLSGLTVDEQAANIAASVFYLGIFDALYIHMLNSVMDPVELHQLRLHLLEHIGLSYARKATRILSESYDRESVILLQAVSARVWNRTLQSTLSVNYHVLSPISWDASNANEETNMILINKKVFLKRKECQDLTPWVMAALREIDKEVHMLLKKGSLFVVKADLMTEGQYIFASVAMRAAWATVKIMAAINETLTDLSLVDIPFVVGINTGVGLRYPHAGHWTLQGFINHLSEVSPSLTTAFDSEKAQSLGGPLLRADQNDVWTLMQTKPSNATRLADISKPQPSVLMPTHHVLFDSRCFKVFNISKDNTGERRFDTSERLPSLEMPYAHPLLAVELEPDQSCFEVKATDLEDEANKLWMSRLGRAAVFVGVPFLILLGTTIPHV